MLSLAPSPVSSAMSSLSETSLTRRVLRTADHTLAHQFVGVLQNRLDGLAFGRHENQFVEVDVGGVWDQFALTDEAHGGAGYQLGDPQHAAGVEDPGPAGQHHGGGFEGLDEKLTYLVGEKFGIGGSGFRHGSCPVLGEGD
jgi:hypothetical protein